jgi:hypothetical protein
LIISVARRTGYGHRNSVGRATHVQRTGLNGRSTLALKRGNRTMGYVQLAQYERKAKGGGDGIPIGVFTKAGVPTNNVDFVGQAVVGSTCVNTSSGAPYKCTATDGSTTITWAVV